jgi:uncharacterized protein (TIGR02302 family)
MNKRLSRKTVQARRAILWERLLVGLWTPASVFAASAAILISGVLSGLPGLVRFACLAAVTLACLWSLKPLLRIVLPSRAEALRRIDRESNVAHRAASAHADALAPELGDPATARIWEAHKAQQLGLLDRLKAGWPRSGVKALDPLALRLAAALALIAAIFLHAGDPVSNIKDALRVAPAAPAVVTSLDAWITPPAYTGKPPLLLTSAAMSETLARDGELTVPENATLTVRVGNGRLPRIAFFALTDGAAVAQELTDIKATAKVEGQSFKAEAALTRPALVKILDGEAELASWRVSILPDMPPTVRITDPPHASGTGALDVDWAATDDYGVAAITAEIALSDAQDDGEGIAGNGVFLYDPPAFPVALKSAQPRDAKGKASNDLTAHPWAGLAVDMTLTARDAAGRTGVSEVRTFKLPERNFFKPLARALIEQRKALISDPDDTSRPQALLEALLVYPRGLIDGSGIHLGIRTVLSRLANAESQEDVQGAVEALWSIALLIEEGDLAGARAELEAIRKELERALREGASPEKIAELMDKMRKAMDRYVTSMEEQAKKRADSGKETGKRQAGKQISSEDLKKMLDQIEELSRNGANEAAQEMLSQLDDILKNMEPGMAEMQPQDGPMSQMLNELSDMMRRQQQLMDDTQKMQEPGQQGDSGEEQGLEPGSRGQRPSPGELSAQQEALGKMLQELMDQMGKGGMQPPQSLGSAGKSMKGAAESLGKGEKGRALGDQGEAMQALRDGAQNMAKQLSQQGEGQQGNEGEHGEARGDNRDPLGRPMATKGEDMGPEKNMLPGDIAMRRAREILDMLRARANDAGRPKLERDYIDRLLRGLY